MKDSIIDKLKLGDEKAFENIYNQYYALLCRFAYRLLGDSLLAEEIVDDVIFYLWEHRAEFDISSSLRAYLLRAVRNRCLNELHAYANVSEVSFSVGLSETAALLRYGSNTSRIRIDSRQLTTANTVVPTAP